MTCLLAHGGRLSVSMAGGLSLHFVALHRSKRTKKQTNIVRFHFLKHHAAYVCVCVCVYVYDGTFDALLHAHLLVLHEAFYFVVGVAVAVWVELLVLDHALLQRSI